MTVESLIAHYGLAAIFLGAGIEGEAAAIAGGVLAHRGLIPLWAVGLANWAGAMLAGQILFGVGRGFREHAWIRSLRARPAYGRVTGALERYPTGFIFAYRFIFGFRIMTPLVIGSSQLSALRFTLLNAIGGALWSLVFTGLGYAFGEGIKRLFGHLPTWRHLIVLAAIVLAVLVAAWIGRRLYLARKATA